MKKIILAALGLFTCTLTSSAIEEAIPPTFDVVENTSTDLQINFGWDTTSGGMTTYYNNDGFSYIYIDVDPVAQVYLDGGEFPALGAAGVASVDFSANLFSFNLAFTGTFAVAPNVGSVVDGEYSLTYTFTRSTGVPDGGNTLLLLSLGVGGVVWMSRRKVRAAA